MDKATSKHAVFSDMARSTAEDWAIIIKEQTPFTSNGGKRVLAHLRLLEDDYGGFPVDRLSHCLQTATGAYRDGRSTDYVVMALLHDIGDTLGAYNHPEYDTLAIEFFEPMVMELFARPLNSIYKAAMVKDA